MNFDQKAKQLIFQRNFPTFWHLGGEGRRRKLAAGGTEAAGKQKTKTNQNLNKIQ